MRRRFDDRIRHGRPRPARRLRDFTDYGPGYFEFNDGRLTGGFALSSDATGDPSKRGALVVLYASNPEETQRRVEASGGKIVKPIFRSRVAGAFASPTWTAMSSPGSPPGRHPHVRLAIDIV